MANTRSQVADSTDLGDLGPLRDSFLIHLHAENKAPSTRVTYAKAIDQFSVFLAETGMPRHVAGLRREHVEAFLVSLQERGMRPATVSQRYRSLQQLFRWLLDEGEVRESPMAKMKPPHVPEEPPPVISEEEIRRLFRVCAGDGFEDRRDLAVLHLFYDSGIRRGELAGLRLEDLVLADSVVFVIGKGRRPRAASFGRRTAKVLDRYVRARAKHPYADTPWLWLGKRGRLTDTGVEQVVKRRGQQAGVRIHPHQLRHTFAHLYLAGGGQEGDLMRLAGWKSRQMLSRYGASVADQRARANYREHSPADRL